MPDAPAPPSLDDALRRGRDGSLALLRDLVRLQREGEAAVQARVAGECAALGCEVETLAYSPAEVPMREEFAADAAMAAEPRASVVARLRGTGGDGGRSLILFAHPDGEPLAGLGAWRRDPFAGAVEGGRLHGWGVADDLAGVAVMVEALRAVAASGARPRGDVLAASTPSKRHARGVAAVLRHARHRADAAVYLHPAESGVGMREVKAICGGQLHATVAVVGRPPDTTEPGHAAFAHLAVNPLHGGMAVARALAALGEARAARVRHPRIEAAVGRATNVLLSFARLGEPGRFGRVPAECVLGVSVSFPPGESLSAVQAEVEAALREAAAAEPWLAANPPRLEWVSGTTGAEVPEGHPLFAAASAAVEEVTGEPPFVNALHTGSDIRVPMVQHGIPTVGLGPLGGDLSQNGAHDEWVDVEDYLRAVRVTAGLILRWCGTGAGGIGPG